MPELETLFVRIETDLSLFKQGMAEARRETRGFAKDARSTFSGVGAALDLRHFRDELAASEAAAKQSAERMKKAFAEVGKVQLESARQVLKTLAQSIDRQPGQPAAKVGAESGRSAGSKGGGSSDLSSGEGAGLGVTIAGILVGILAGTAAAVTFPASAPTLALFFALSAAIGGLTPAMNKFSKSLLAEDSDTTSSLDERIEQLRRTIDDLEKKRLGGPRGGPPLSTQIKARDDALAKAQKELAAAVAERNALLDIEKMANDEFLVELQRLFGDTASQNQEFLAAFTELCDCLRQLCARIEELTPAPSGAAGAGGVRPDGVGFDPHASMGGGQVISASFSGASPFGGAGLGLDGGEQSLTGFAERLAELPGAFVETREQAEGLGSEIGSLAERLIQSNALLGEQSGLLGQLTAQAPVLGGELAALFEAGSEEGRVFAEVADAVGASLLDAFEGAIERGESLSDVLKGLALDMAEIALKAAGNALLESILGGLFGGGGGLGPQFTGTGAVGLASSGSFAKGGAFAPAGSVMARNIKAFARGGIVDTPEAFAFAHGLGIMGEAGPEAILPLARARSGELGVRAMIGGRPEAGGSAPAAAGPTFNIDARGADREGFRELMGLIIKLDGKLNQVARSIPAVSLRAWANHRRRGGFR
jgi:hypothetical protein